MSDTLILHLADLHLDSPLRGLEADRDAPADLIRRASRMAFENAVAFALERRVQLVLIAGDLFDGDWPDWRSGQFLVAQLARLTQAGIQVVAIRGNHDAESVVTRTLPALDRFTLLRADQAETILIPELSLAVHGQSFAARAVLSNLALAYPAPLPGMLNIGLLHTALGGREGHEPYAPCTIEQLAAHGYDYWALGHVHQRQTLHEDPWIVFPGNPQGRHIKETGAKGGTLITVRAGRIAAVEHQDFDVLRWCRLEVALDEAGDEDSAYGLMRRAAALAVAQAGARTLALRIVLTGATPAHAALSRDASETAGRVRAELAAAGLAAAWLEGLRIETRPAIDLAALQARGDALGRLAAAIAAAAGDRVAGEAASYAGALLDRAPGLRTALDPSHAGVLAASGALPEELVQRARALLLARLAGG